MWRWSTSLPQNSNDVTGHSYEFTPIVVYIFSRKKNSITIPEVNGFIVSDYHRPFLDRVQKGLLMPVLRATRFFSRQRWSIVCPFSRDEKNAVGAVLFSSAAAVKEKLAQSPRPASRNALWLQRETQHRLVISELVFVKCVFWVIPRFALKWLR